jgi:hypothetical protein
MSVTKKIKKKFRIKQVGKHTRKHTGGAVTIGKALQTALKNAKKNWDYGVEVAQQENPSGSDLNKALQYRGVNEPGSTIAAKKQRLNDDGNEFNIIAATIETRRYNDIYYYYNGAYARAHIHLYGRGNDSAGFHGDAISHTGDLDVQNPNRLEVLNTWDQNAQQNLGNRNQKANWKTFFTALRPILRDVRRGVTVDDINDEDTEAGVDAEDREAVGDAAEGSTSRSAAATPRTHKQAAEELYGLLNKIVEQASAGWVIAKSMRYGINCGHHRCKSAIYFCNSSLRHIQDMWRTLTAAQLTSIQQQLTLIQDKVEKMSEEVLTQSMSMVGMRHTKATAMRNSDNFKNDLKNLLTYIFMIKWCSVGAKKYALPLKWKGVEKEPSEFIDEIWHMNIQTAELEDQINRGIAADALLQAGPQETLGMQFLTGLRDMPTIDARINREAQAAAALSAVILGNDEDALSAAIDEASGAGGNAELMSKARERLTQLKEEREAAEAEQRQQAWEASPEGRAQIAEDRRREKAEEDKRKAQEATNNDQQERRLYTNGNWLTKQQLMKFKTNPVPIEWRHIPKAGMAREVDKIWKGLQQKTQPPPRGGKSTRKRKKNQRRKTKRRRR